MTSWILILATIISLDNTDISKRRDVRRTESPRSSTSELEDESRGRSFSYPLKTLYAPTMGKSVNSTGVYVRDKEGKVLYLRVYRNSRLQRNEDRYQNPFFDVIGKPPKRLPRRYRHGQ